MNLRTLFPFCVMVSIASCDISSNDKAVKPPEIIGTWKLISTTTIEKGDTVFSKPKATEEMIKIINDSHFAFLNHDLKKGKDSSAVFVAGGGSYTLSGDKYSEHLQYCNYREWEDNKFDFNVSFHGDTLVQRGIERVSDIGVDREIIERYIRVNK